MFRCPNTRCEFWFRKWIRDVYVMRVSDDGPGRSKPDRVREGFLKMPLQWEEPADECSDTPPRACSWSA